jgi:hypothetical protein
MVQASYLKYGLIPVFVIFCSVLLTATEVLAQITPAPASDGHQPQSSTSSSTPDTKKSPITPSPNPDEQDITSSEEQVGGGTTTTTENTESDPTESLGEAITNQVNKVLSAAGIGLGS